MNKSAYFQNIARRLAKPMNNLDLDEGSAKFVELKLMEYWVRFLKKNPYHLNASIVLGLMDGDNKAQMEVVRQLALDDRERGVEMIDEFGTFSSSRAKQSFCGPLGTKFLKQYPKGDYESTGMEILEKLKSTEAFRYNAEDWHRLQRIIAGVFIPYAMAEITKGVDKGNNTINRIEKLQNLLRLKDDEMELVLFFWLSSDSESLEIYRENGKKKANMFYRENLDVSFDALALGMSVGHVTEMLADDAALSRLCVISKDLDLDEDIKKHLSGQREILEWSDVVIAPPAKVSFEELSKERSDADILAYLLSNHDGTHPLNILFYGQAGTGKTELSKAIAEHLHIPLYMIKSSSDFSYGIHDMLGLNERILRRRIRNLQLAAWQCEKNKGIILVDEADHLLNGLEKGVLNMLIESIHVPIIWISNSIQNVEMSTRRRFEFSMEFKSFDAEKRAKVLKSVMNTLKVPDMLDENGVKQIASEFPVSAAGYTLAIQQALPMIQCNKEYSSTVMRKILEAHANLLEVNCECGREESTHAPSYSLKGLNIDGNVDEVMEIAENFNRTLDSVNKHSNPQSLNILLYGAPGTGKTEFVRYLARKLNRSLVVRRASDLINMYVGETEKNIRDAFKEAEESKSILFFDEADSFIGDRKNASRNFEVSQVNELLTQLENFNGIFIAATNFDERLDLASRRRFALKLQFNYLKPDGIEAMWKSFFPQFDFPAAIRNFKTLAPGDFNAVYSRLRYLPSDKLTAKRIVEELEKEVNIKGECYSRKMGF